MINLSKLFGGNSSSTQLSKIEQDIKAIKSRLDELESSADNADVSAVLPVLTDYVTPQMYGAKANGYSDDTDAVQAALDSGKSVFLPTGTYTMSEPLVIDGKHFWGFHGGDATIRYTGEGYAIRILMAENCHIEIGSIIAPNGGGIEFCSISEDSWNQYIRLEFSYIRCKTDCIHIEVSNGGWCNENQIYGGRFASGQNGVYLHHSGENYTNGWKFYNCGIEGVTNGFLLDAGRGYIHDMIIVAPRYEESHETILKTLGRVFDCLWIGTGVFKPATIECSTGTSRFEILAPIRTIWDGELIRHRGCIMNGVLMGEKPTYETVR